MKLILALFFSLSAFLLQAQSFFDNHAFSLSGGLGFLYGQGDELLYQLDESGYLSRLGWDIKPLICYELSLDLAPKKDFDRVGFFSSLALKAGIFTEGNGLMRDYDWVGGGALTDYSEHDAVIDRAFMAAFQAGAVFPVNSSLALKLFGGLSYVNFFWTAHNGFYRYSNPTRSGDFTGPVANYRQDWLILYPGAAAQFTFSPSWQAEFSILVSPLLLFAAVDHHLLLIDNTGKSYSKYTDRAIGGFYVKPTVELSYSPGPRLRLSLGYAFTYMQSAKGTIDAQNTGANSNNQAVFRAANKSGGILSFHEVALKAAFIF